MNYDFRKIKYSEKEIREYIKNNPEKLDSDFCFDWSRISACQDLSESFIREFQDRLLWAWILKYQNLSEEFLIEFVEKVDNWGLNLNEKIPEDVKERIINFKKFLEIG